MRFAILGSGSRGNAVVVEAGGTRVLIDCGFTAAETERRLARLGLAAEGLDAILLTHEHGDHVAGAGPLARRHGLPVWCTPGTRLGAGLEGVEVCTVVPEETFAVGALQVRSYVVPHDGRETVQYLLGDGAATLGIVTDAGSVTPHMEAVLDGCDGLVLECNHDERLLAEGPYPPPLKRRIRSDWGHLSNRQAAALLARLDHHRLRHVVAAHLSETNNTPGHARAALAAVLGCRPEEVDVAEQARGLGWRALAP
ncbi:MBL fold metallo-hydrolase [Inmirania thermothiophila]|uniref:Phosphoribosyl 1,2-cyclic phosphodiesterase n=1 Tax=Inmirania thermothiophila TaxID=1750597 RepID=A0A3N1XT64_9GAMM|nr:MBL fold metallo-hydrolase [Inmirania thermothiophila]ROR29823.1 phosphoribosyl 1,2-cyclic phosphodiesterase [Inmirania thermothiophila]